MDRYNSLAELYGAFQSGQLRRTKGYFLLLDNDSASMWDGQGEIFEMHPEELLRQALDMLGIPWETV